MAKFLITETIHVEKVKTVRLGGNATNTRFTLTEQRKLVKLIGESQYGLCAVGDPIEGCVTSVEATGTVANAIYDGYMIGGIVSTGYLEATFEGSQAAGTGAIAVGDYVVAGTQPAIGTINPTVNGISGPGAPKVRKATDQAAAKADPHAWRVVSLGEVGTGAVGTVGTIERV